MKAILTALSLALVLAFSAGALAKEDKKADTKTITGKSGCAECEGVAKAGDPMHIMLTDKDGTRWVLIGDSAINTSMTVKTFQSFVMAFWVSSSSIAGTMSEKAWDNMKLLEAAR